MSADHGYQFILNHLIKYSNCLYFFKLQDNFFLKLCWVNFQEIATHPIQYIHIYMYAYIHVYIFRDSFWLLLSEIQIFFLSPAVTFIT